MSAFYLSQIIAVLVGIHLGRHDAPATNAFATCGSNSKYQKRFHRSGFHTRLSVVAGLSVIILFREGGLPSWSFWNYTVFYQAFLAGVVNWCIMHAPFDPVINVTRTRLGYPDFKFPWYYLGDASSTDRRLKRIFGRWAGVWKLIICLTGASLGNTAYLLWLRN